MSLIERGKVSKLVERLEKKIEMGDPANITPKGMVSSTCFPHYNHTVE